LKGLVKSCKIEEAPIDDEIFLSFVIVFATDLSISVAIYLFTIVFYNSLSA